MNNYFDKNEDFKTIIGAALPNNKIVEIKQNTTGWTNIVYEVKTADDIEYLFRFPRDDFWSRTMFKDCTMSSFINGKTSFNTVLLEQMYDKGRIFSKHKKVKGIPLSSVMNDLTLDQVISVSKKIALFMKELHSIDVNNLDSKIELIRLVDFLNEMIETHLLSEDISFWHYDEFSKKDHSCLIHGDFNPGNILLTNDYDIAGVIDFGFSGYGNEYFDVARIIGRLPSVFKDNIINNYEAFTKRNLDYDILNQEIEIWSNIDRNYISYMKCIGIQ